MTTTSPGSGERQPAVSPARIGSALGFVLLVTLTIPGVAAATDTVPLEAESYTASQNTGGTSIVTVACGAARGGLAVDGVDHEGDYIQWNLSLPSSFVFRDSLRSAGFARLVRRFAILFLPAGSESPVATDTLTTPAGLGLT
ncbi:MAG TPA: hypothetical protein VMS88_07605 [Terriglobales bacterium]|nr:hypothetical protein [Terriglobales bacterium]